MYIFPTLTNAEILQCMGELSIPLTEQELSKLSSMKMIKIFESFLDVLMGITREELEQPHFSVLENLENPELHQQSLIDIAFFRHLLKLMTAVGIQDFSMKDLMKPEPLRVRRILSATINFAKFREEHLNEFERHTRLTDELIERKEQLTQHHQDIHDKVNAIKAQRAGEEYEVKRLEEEISLLTVEVNRFNREQAKLHNDIQVMKQQSSDLSDKIANSKFMLMNSKQELNKIKSQIVEEPEKIPEIIAELTSQINSEKDTITNLEKKYRELHVKIETLQQIETDIDKTKKVMDECHSEIKRFQDLQSKIVHEQESIARKQIELKELDLKDQQLRRQIVSTQEKISKLQKQHAQKREALQGQLEILQTEHKSVSLERLSLQTKIDENDKTTKELQQQILELKRHHESEMTMIRADFIALKNQIVYYHGDLSRSLTLV